MVRVGDEYDGLTEVCTVDDEEMALSEADWDAPFVPVSEPSIDPGDESRPFPTHEIVMAEGGESITRTWTSRDENDDRKFEQLFAEIAKLIDKALGR